MTTPQQTTYAKATLEYDTAHQQALMDAVTAAIFDASKVSDCNAVIIRTGEAAEALLTVLAGVLAMSPAVTRSPTAIREAVDHLGKRLRKKVAAAEQSAELSEFMRRTFRGVGTEGTA